MLTVDQVGEIVDALISDDLLLEQLRVAVAAKGEMDAAESAFARVDGSPGTDTRTYSDWVKEVENAQDEADVRIYTLVRSLHNALLNNDAEAQADFMRDAFA